MHELSIAEQIVSQSLASIQSYEVHRVLSIEINVGILSGVVPECLDFVFPEACRGTLLEGTQLVIHGIPLTLKCSSCGKISQQEQIQICCSHCLSSRVEIIDGKDIIIAKMEFD